MLAGTALCWLLICVTAWGNHNTTDLVSTGPNGGNGAISSQFRGASADGARVFFQSNEQLVVADTDTRMDIYERASGVTTLLTTGPNGGNGNFNASFSAVSADGSRLFFRTSESLVAADSDTAQDIYERAGGVTTLMSGGTGSSASVVIFDAISPDGSSVLFDTYDQLVAADTDTSRDVYRRSGATTTLESVGGPDGDAVYAGASGDRSHVYFHSDFSFAASDFDTTQDVYARSGGATTHLSIGPAGGNGNDDFDYHAYFDGASANGSKVWLHTDEALVASDTDTANDVYERVGAAITAISTGNAETGAYFDGASADGSRVFFDTMEALTGGDTDASTDIYERAGAATTLISTGPDGGNGAFFSAFQDATSDGSKVFFHTSDSLVASDTDGAQDVYQRAAGTTTLISTGPLGSNAPLPAAFKGASQDGARVFFDTPENLVAHATGVYPDIYEREGDVTTFLSTGPVGGNGDFYAFFMGASDDGSRVFLETDEALVAGDTDTSQDVYVSSITNHGAYVRPKGATPLTVSLVPAYSECTAPNRTHGPGLAFPSCNPPAQASPHLTVGSPDANGKAASSAGSVKLQVLVGVPSTPADEADVRFTISIADVRNSADLSDYTGELQLDATLRTTDRLSGSAPVDTGTVTDMPFPVTVPCAATANTAIGASCAVTTTADSLVPGSVRELKRTIWQIARVALLDGGADGLAATADNSTFATQGLFVP